MPEIVLTEEQAKVLAETLAPVPVKNPAGCVVGHLDPMVSPERFAEMKRRAANPSPYYYTTASVTAMLDALQAERDRIGPFDAAYAAEFVKRTEASDPEKYGPKVRA